MSKGNVRRTLLRNSALVGSLCAALWAGQALAQAQTYAFDIPAESLSASLREFARVSGQQIIFTDDLVAGKSAPALHGSYSPDAALAQLLAGTNLTVERSPSGAIMVRRKNAQAASNEGAASLAVAPETVVVTGTRIPSAAKDTSQDVKTYTREQIDNSGQTNVADFLGTLPDVGVSSFDNAHNSTTGLDNAVQLHGLPVGTTLLLLDGHRLEGAGSSGTGAFFDLNSIPLSAVERIDVLPTGSSAIYGSDAIAGVVNIVLKKDFDGFEANVGNGFASGLNDLSANVAWGGNWNRASFSIIGSFENNSELEGTERSITANNNYSRFGGPDRRRDSCNPGDVYSRNGLPLPGAPLGSNAKYAAVSSNSTNGTPTFSDFNYGVLNSCSVFALNSVIPEHLQAGLLARGDYELTPNVELFAQFLYDHAELTAFGTPPTLTGSPASQTYSVSTTNPYNPFGEKVGVTDMLTDIGRLKDQQDTDFLQAVVGARGDIFDGWHWEVDGTFSSDWSNLNQARQNRAAIQAALNSSNVATALNPFITGPAASPQVLASLVEAETQETNGQIVTVNGFVRGTPVDLPAGSVQVVLGGEYDYTALSLAPLFLGGAAFSTPFDVHREAYSVFGEARIPVFSMSSSAGKLEFLTATVAGRYDHYSDFGDSTTPQFGIELRPISSILIRGTYSEAFQAPTLTELFSSTFSLPSAVSDPLNGGTIDDITLTQGGNTSLKPQTGISRTLGIVYSSDLVPGLRASVTNWDISLNGFIQLIDSQTIVNNASLFPGAVVRASGCGSPICPITAVTDTYFNFGQLRVQGVDYQINYDWPSDFGDWTPSLSATQTYRYTAALTPSAPVLGITGKAQDTGDWAPQWKATAGLGWRLGPYSANVDGRYVGSYQDYDTSRKIGNFWLIDTNVRVALGELIDSEDPRLQGTYVSVGGVNIFNTLPQYSNFLTSFVGYDPAQADIRGRFVYFRVGAKF